MFLVTDLLTYLEGKWSFSRQILGEMKSGTMEGKATFSSISKGLFYREKGLLKQGNYEGFFEQEYFLTFLGQDRKQAEVYRQEGAFFFLLDLSHSSQKVEHLCGDDFYRGTIESFETSLKCQWDVGGPRKGYTLVSHFVKI